MDQLAAILEEQTPIHFVSVTDHSGRCYQRLAFADETTLCLVWPPALCLNPERAAGLCDGLTPTCERYRAVAECEAEEGLKPYGCRAYRNCQRKVQIVAGFPPHIERIMQAAGRPKKAVAF